MVTQKEVTILNIANVLTTIRILLAPMFMLLVFEEKYITAFVVILLATLTDFLDGTIARIWKLQTRLGKLLDPAADKIIVFFAALTLMIKFGFPIWIGIIIILRDVMVSIGAILFLLKNRSSSGSHTGRYVKHRVFRRWFRPWGPRW